MYEYSHACLCTMRLPGAHRKPEADGPLELNLAAVWATTSVLGQAQLLCNKQVLLTSEPSPQQPYH